MDARGEQTTPVVSTLDGGLTPHARIANPFPDGIQLPVGSSQGIATNLGRGVGYFSNEVQTGNSIRWNLDIQHEQPGNSVVEVGYIYNHGVHMQINRPLNFVPAQFMSASLTRDQATIGRITSQANLARSTQLALRLVW